ncbi:MAG TPA: SLC13 family permease [Veillonellaceae bacterium]|jgi:sodium-dependent dicarboxylate transporter 2/3/5|uniref:Cation transporter n=1 Tax=Dialister hominis TaxID=2582419 RepID=A0A8D5A0J3_9FIRM|nr:SLC13 family permease [Dialister hominis]BBK24126.1 cation transporter [Dialister hominis]HJI43559.1 SLC13 family permease [Veillonellaceae bacterium]
MDPAITTLCVLAVAAFLFVTELIPLAVTAMAACTALGILGVLPSKQVYAGLSNSTVVLFGGMFVIGAAMFKTGLAEAIGVAVVKKAGTGEIRLMGAIMLVTIVLSSVSSNTGTVACLMPVIIGICQAAKIPASKELMPLAIAANVGGTITMIGTPPNVIVTGALAAAGLPTFGFFEFAKIGIPLSIIILLYTLFVGRHFLPVHNAGDMDEEAVKAAKEEAGSAGDAPKSKTKMWISGLILIGVVLAMALGLKNLPLHTAAVTGAILCVITGCLKEKEAYAGIDWVTIFLFAGMLSVATAMDKTGAGKLIADTVVGMMGSNPNPYVLTAVLFLISNILTQFMSNTASAALLAPIGISIAQEVGCDPKPVLMALGIAASMAFATPMATPPNTLVLGPGNFTFNDYVKVGVPMCLLSWVACVVIIPIFWPFH